MHETSEPTNKCEEETDIMKEKREEEGRGEIKTKQNAGDSSK